MKGSLRNIISKVLCWILLLQVINISINPPDLKRLINYTVATQQVAPVNEIESVYELIADGLFDKQVPDSDEDDFDSISPFLELYCDEPVYTVLTMPVFPIGHIVYYQSSLSLVNQEPRYLPPKQA